MRMLPRLLVYNNLVYCKYAIFAVSEMRIMNVISHSVDYR